MPDAAEFTVYRRLLRFDWIARKDKSMRRDAVLEALRDLRRRINDVSPTGAALEDMARTTEALLAAEEDGTLRWTQLRTLIVEGLDYVAVYRELGNHSWSEMSDAERAGVGLGRDDTGMIIASSPHRMALFISYVGWITKYVEDAGGDTGRDLRPDRDVMRDFGPSTEEWLALSFHGEAIETRVDRNSKCSPRAGILEMNLMEDQVFVADLRATKECLGSELLRKLWYYDYAANAMAEVNSNHDISAWTGRPVPHGCTELLNALCRRWCLSAVSNAVGSIRRHGLYITVSRPKVSWRRDGTGVDVFIPRFYKYNDLANYRHGDFRPLLAAMARIFPTDRLQRRQTARIQEAMRYRASLVERGNAPVKAWEKTRMKFSWSPRTATDYLGPRPRR